jgi:hypothetical protein
MLKYFYSLALRACAVTLSCILAHVSSGTNSAQADELGKSWTIRQAPSGLREVVYGAGRFVAFGAGKLATSHDAITWTEQTPLTGNLWPASIFAQGKFVALSAADSEQFPTNVMSSTDGITWSLASDGLSPGTQWHSIAYGNGTFVAGSVGTFSATYMATSPDAVTWTPVMVPSGNAGIVELAFGNGAFIAVQSSNGLADVRSLLRSTNGIDWQEQALPSGASPELLGVAFGRGQFIAVGENSTIISSPDGITWTNRTAPGSAIFVEVVDAGDRYIAFGYDATSYASVIVTSPDGITWTQQSSPSTLSRISATYAHGVVVALSALESAAETVITSGTFKTAADIVFRKGSARLSDEARSTLVTNVSELDTTRKVRLSVLTRSVRKPGAALLARRRLAAITKYVRSQGLSRLVVRAIVKFSSSVSPDRRDRVTATLSYR